MKTLKLSDINLYSFGNSIQTAGVIWSGDGEIFVTLLPGKDEDLSNFAVMPLTLEEWQLVMRQTDLLEVEMFAQDETGIVKKLVRKTQRTVDARMQWACFLRDNYTCRYCGRTGIPLTVDHVILWEKGGATILENLVTACRSCNSDRGNIEYDVWVASDNYKKRSANLPYDIKHLNAIELVARLPELRALTLVNPRSR